jgi:catechol 2,3-dioxygenase-like lactoylglutathione lyase family enzyme
MRDYQYDHVHLRSPDPDAMARFFETMFGAEVTRSVYPPGRSILGSSASRCG